VDEATALHYTTHAALIAARYEAVGSPVAAYFPIAFAPASKVLDVGAGSGRDLAQLLKHGYDAYGIEPSEALRSAAVKHHPEIQGRIADGALPEIGDAFGSDFDGILCSAVLMHVPESELFDAAFSFRRMLRPHGRLLLSLPLARDDVGVDDRDAAGRLFKPYTAEYLQLLFERIGFQLIGRWDTDDALGRSGTRWYTLLLELRSGGPLRAVDQIEGILNRDRKVATYKLALFRALAEIATQEPRLARWTSDGRVGVPVTRIAERWLFYYWPIFAADRFVPQSQAEGKGDRNPVAFRAPMRDLMAEFAGQGEFSGLTAWQLAWASGQVAAGTQGRLNLALRSIVSTIIDGPVEHSGGSLQTGRVFTYEQTAREVVMAAELWRELTLLAHWIIDAVIVRWAALTERFAHRQGIRSGDVLPLLLARPAPERATAMARQIYLSAGVDRCAWTGKRLGARFAVDHVIPFSLWGNNDLWNLLPVDERVNGQKADKLPSDVLLRDRRLTVIANWSMLRDQMPDAFARQGAHLLGRPVGGPLSWEDDLFTRLCEAVELTALQRGVERWYPRP
jgi:SAM-dependent methyltransferase